MGYTVTMTHTWTFSVYTFIYDTVTIHHGIAWQLISCDIKQIDAIMLDFTKTFDKVFHKTLTLKLQYYGITRHPLNLVSRETTFLAPFCSFCILMTSHYPVPTPEFLLMSLLFRLIDTEDDRILVQHDIDALKQKTHGEWHSNDINARCYDSSDQINQSLYIANSWHPHPRNTSEYTSHNEHKQSQQNIWIPEEKQTTAHQTNTLVRPILEYCTVLWEPYPKQHWEARTG